MCIKLHFKIQLNKSYIFIYCHCNSDSWRVITKQGPRRAQQWPERVCRLLNLDTEDELVSHPNLIEALKEKANDEGFLLGCQTPYKCLRIENNRVVPQTPHHRAREVCQSK